MELRGSCVPYQGANLSRYRSVDLESLQLDCYDRNESIEQQECYPIA
jgi:hypothetical protein